MNTSSSEENRIQQDSSTSEEKTISESSSYHIGELPKITINKNLDLFFVKDCSYVSLTPIIPTNKIDFLFKLYQIPTSKEEIMTKIKAYINKQESKIDKIYTLNDIRVHKSRGNIIIIDEKFNKDCIDISKQSNNAMQIIADKIALSLFNNKKIIYKYEKNKDNDKMIYVVANLKIDEDINVKSDLFEYEKNARNDVNKKIIMKYLPKKIVKEIMDNIGKLMNLEDKIKILKKERYEKHLSEAGNDHKLLNKKRNLPIEEFSKRLPYYNMLEKDTKKNKEGKNKYKYKNKNNKVKKNNKIILDEDEEDFFVNTEGTPLNEILLGDPIIVNIHLRDFKYTPLKLFEMIRDSEKFRGIDFKIEYSNINDKNYSVKFKSIIISQKLGIKVEGFGNSKEEAGNKCSLNLLSVLFKNIFRTYHQVHDYFEHKNRRYLDIILKNDNDDNDDNNYDNEDSDDSEESDEDNNIEEEKNNFSYGNNNIKKENENGFNKDNDNIKKEKENENKDEIIQRSKFANWVNYSNKRKKVIEDSEYWCSKKKNLKIKKSPSPINYNELFHQNHMENKKNSKKSNSESQESCVKFDFDQVLSSEFMNNTSSSDINIINNLNNYNLSNSSNTREIEDLIKSSNVSLSESDYSLLKGTKRKTKERN